jgi:hypothetical protein
MTHLLLGGISKGEWRGSALHYAQWNKDRGFMDNNITRKSNGPGVFTAVIESEIRLAFQNRGRNRKRGNIKHVKPSKLVAFRRPDQEWQTQMHTEGKVARRYVSMSP